MKAGDDSRFFLWPPEFLCWLWTWSSASTSLPRIFPTDTAVASTSWSANRLDYQRNFDIRLDYAQDAEWLCVWVLFDGHNLRSIFTLFVSANSPFPSFLLLSLLISHTLTYLTSELRMGFGPKLVRGRSANKVKIYSHPSPVIEEDEEKE